MTTRRKSAGELKDMDRKFDAAHKRQASKREAFLNAPVNAEIVRETSLALEIASELYKIRQKANLTQVDLARLMSTNQATIARVEKGRDLKLSTIERFALACGRNVKITIK